ncbi:MAG: IS1595 family transposase [Spirochaetaceae bacterium]|nr:IS1595 family transposase [Spirochaetaceae bacterium]
MGASFQPARRRINTAKEIKAPGKAFREGISLIELFDMFPDNAAAERWFAEHRWPNGKPVCPHCGHNEVQVGAAHSSQPYRCRFYLMCGKRFSVKIGTVMEGSNIPLRKWAIGIYLMVTTLKGVSSMKLHRDLKIGQKAAWHMAHRIRMAWNGNMADLFNGPAEVDEAYFGGKEANKHADKKLNAGRGTVGKVTVAGVKDRESNRISAAVVDSTTKRELHEFVAARVELGSAIYTDDLQSYRGLPNHGTVQHSVGEYVAGHAHINGMESFWAMMKRGYYGTHHRMSPKHLDRYVDEFEGRHNARCDDTVDQMVDVARGMVGKRLRYRDLIRPNGRPSGARELAA